MSGYPILLDGARIRALIVGAGRAAHRKAVALLESGATVRVVAPAVGLPLRGLATECPRLSLIERAYSADDIADATLVIAATDVRAVNAQVLADAHAKGRLVNVADAPDDGDFVTVAAHHAGSLLVGVSAGGVPAAAARIRDEIAHRFDGRYADALAALVNLRRRLLDRGDAAAWGAAERALLADDFCATVEAGAFPDHLARWTSAEPGAAPRAEARQEDAA